MRIRRLVVILLLCCGAWAAGQEASRWTVPAAVKKLNNGLVVVVSEDHSAPTFGLCLSYRIGFRLEPEGRTGFAHLFEHMMFEGTPSAPKGVLDRVVEGGGGWINGMTRWDFTDYIESAPVSALEPVLWLEADRMKTLDFSVENLDNQRKVVEEEVRVNVLNQPYGGFYWLDLPMKAFDKFPNAHNFYGEFRDLDAATLEDVKGFFERYYAPNNAVLCVAGDVNPEEVFAKVEKYFGGIPPRAVPLKPDVSEAPQKAERRVRQEDRFAQVPALAIGYRMPPRNSRDAIVGAVVGELLHNGQASRLYQALVKEKQVALEVEGGFNWPLGNAFDYDGPTLMTSLIMYPSPVTGAQVVAAYDAVLEDLAARGPTSEELERIRAKMRSDWYEQLEIPVFRAMTLAHAALFEADPARVNRIPHELASVSGAEIQAFVRSYLVKTNRTIIDRVPASTEEKGAEQ